MEANAPDMPEPSDEQTRELRESETFDVTEGSPIPDDVPDDVKDELMQAVERRQDADLDDARPDGPPGSG